MKFFETKKQQYQSYIILLMLTTLFPSAILYFSYEYTLAIPFFIAGLTGIIFFQYKIALLNITKPTKTIKNLIIIEKLLYFIGAGATLILLNLHLKADKAGNINYLVLAPFVICFVLTIIVATYRQNLILTNKK